VPLDGFLESIGAGSDAVSLIKIDVEGMEADVIRGAVRTISRWLSHSPTFPGLIDVSRVALQVFLVSGALAGLAGGIEVTGVTFALYEGLSPGYGYTAIAVALLARLDPLLVAPSALLFGALEAGATAMQRDAGVPAAFVTVVEGSLVLLVLLLPVLTRRYEMRAARSRDVAA